jgi:lipopolysaccharide/colanic/teichoic acid biosynthesis glycosyltransferase
LDLTCIVVSLPLLIPVVLVIMAVIKLVSRGPVLFRQPRIGYLGEPFVCLKFRTMHLDAEPTLHEDYLSELIHSDAPMTKLDAMGDPRLIRFGSFFRATGLDELPQLINVLRGEMSLVGPRPCTLYEYQNYLPWHKRRFATLPGLTGLWQVSGKNSMTFKEMVDLDIYYARNKTLWFDLKMLLKTFPTLLAQVRELSQKLNSRTAGPGAAAKKAERVATQSKHRRQLKKSSGRKEQKCTTPSELVS